MKLTRCILAVLILLTACSRPRTEVMSPDGRIVFALDLTDDGQPTYAVTVENQPLIASSPLGFLEKSGLNLSREFELKQVRDTLVDETWHQPWGENKELRSHYHEKAYTLTNADGELTFRVRVFDDGLGFRYEYRTAADSLQLTDELTEFALAVDGTSWSIPADFDSYEKIYRTLPLDSLSNANTPMTFKTETGIYASIHEAALIDFPEMNLYRTEDTASIALKAELAQWPDGVKARFTGGSFVSPWRTLQISREAVGLINSSLILNLNAPCVLQGPLEWIRPVKYVGVWWGMHLGIQSWVMGDRHGATTENVKRYIDFAAANNIQAVLAEGWNRGWESWGRPGKVPFDYTKPFDDFDIDFLARYAAEKGVKLLGHHETGGGIANYEAQMEKAFQWAKSKGIDHIKTGYAGYIPGGHKRHDQYMVRHYMKVVRTAAENEISLNVHEPIKPTGIRRTYPNLMSGEGARGMEWNAWSEGNAPEHHEILPFTRLLAGPMDYTPGTFDLLFERTRNHPDYVRWNDNDKGNSRVHTTLAKQLANWVVLYSPVQMASDLIEHYEGHPAFQFFRDYDADCDWSRALQGEPGEYIAVVRRAGERFFLGATTDRHPRTLQIPLDFLKEGVRYQARIYADGENADWESDPQSYVLESRIVTSSDTLTVKMAPGGGQAVSFIPAGR